MIEIRETNISFSLLDFKKVTLENVPMAKLRFFLYQYYATHKM